MNSKVFLMMTVTANVPKSGIGNISMEYSQPWEGGIKALHKLDITVVDQ